jgi:regulator of protease activity HflC (stomatin/prohibitin superfamily)
VTSPDTPNVLDWTTADLEWNTGGYYDLRIQFARDIEERHQSTIEDMLEERLQQVGGKLLSDINVSVSAGQGDLTISSQNIGSVDPATLYTNTEQAVQAAARNVDAKIDRDATEGAQWVEHLRNFGR